MKKLLLLWLCLCSVTSGWAWEEDATTPALTIYNQNFFVARERFPMDLKAGENRVQYAGVAAHIEPDSVILRDPGGRELRVLEQNYRNDPISQQLLLSYYEGKTIEFLLPGGNTVKGKIVRSGYSSPAYNGQGYYQPTAYNEPIIDVDGVLRFGLPGQPLFPSLTGDSILEPTLSWLLEASTPGQFSGEVAYVSSGMTWQSDYNVVVADKSTGKTDLLDVIGWITMRNQSGKTFENARIKLMAGDVNKIQPTLSARDFAARETPVAGAAAPLQPPVQEKAFDEFHLYTLAHATTLRDQETKQVEFVRSTGIHAQRIYVYDGAKIQEYGYYSAEQVRQDQSYGTLSNPKVWVMEEFKNSEANHLGIPLPKGKLRFYRRDTDGHLEFVGENTIDHTPKDETIRIYTGNAFDVVGERKRTNYHLDSSNKWMEESFEIRVRNHKKEPVNVRVVEHLYRWTNWKLTEQSQESAKKDAQTVEFPLTLQRDGEQLVSYTVHYSW